MDQMWIRLIELRNEYFNELTNRDLYTFYRLDIKTDQEYTSDELIRMLSLYTDLLYDRLDDELKKLLIRYAKAEQNNPNPTEGDILASYHEGVNHYGSASALKESLNNWYQAD